MSIQILLMLTNVVMSVTSYRTIIPYKNGVQVTGNLTVVKIYVYEKYDILSTHHCPLNIRNNNFIVSLMSSSVPYLKLHLFNANADCFHTKINALSTCTDSDMLNTYTITLLY